MAKKETQPETGKQSAKKVNKAPPINTSGVQLLRRKDLIGKCAAGRTKLYLIMKEGSAIYDPTFPKGFVIGPDPHEKRPKFWLESDVDRWIDNKKNQGH